MSVALSKSQGTSVLSLQSLASNSVLLSSAIDVTTKFAVTLAIHFGRRSATALTTAVTIRIEYSAKASGDGHWYPLATYLTKIAAVTSQAVNGTCASGQNVVAMTSTTGMGVGDIVYIDNGTIANSEWGRIKVVTSNTSITLEDNLVNAQTGATVYPAGEMFAAQIDCTAVGRLRVVVDGSGTGQAVAVEAELVSGDAIG